MDAQGGTREVQGGAGRRSKCTQELLRRLRSDGLRPSPAPWCSDGFVLEEDRPPTLSDAGLSRSRDALSGGVYLQELASMLPVEVLAAHLPPGDLRCADICAAPGSKATQLLLHLRGRSSRCVLVANELQSQRLDILRCNVVRSGVAEDCLLLQEPGQLLGDLAPGCFDAVLLDAPCSAEGNLRRHPEVLGRIQSEDYHQSVLANAEVQHALLQSAWKLLRPGGMLVYSTCTLNSQENESPCQRLLQEFPSAEVVHLRQLGLDATEDGFLRLWPHSFDTHGFFVACFRKSPEPGISCSSHSCPPLVEWLHPTRDEEIQRIRQEAELGAGECSAIWDQPERMIVSKDGAAFLLPCHQLLTGLEALLLRCPRPGLCLNGPGRNAELRLATTPPHRLDTEEWAALNASQGGGLGALGALMDIHAAKGDVRGAEAVFLDIRQQQLKPDLISYNTLLKAYATARDCEGALRILESLRRAAVLPDITSMSTAMQASVAPGKSALAESLFAKLRRSQLQPDVRTYTNFVRAYAADSRRKDAEALLLQMKEEAIRPDVTCYTALMDLYATLRDRQAAEGLLTKMRPNVVTYGVLLKLYAAEGDVQSAEAALRDMRQTALQPNFLCYTAILGAYAKKGDVVRARDMFNELRSNGWQPDVVTQSTLILAHVRAGELDGAEEVLQRMAVQHVLPNVVCYATLLDGYARAGDVPNAERVLSALLSQRLQPNVVVASAMAKCRANAGDMSGATEELRSFLSARLAPSQRSFGPVLAACARTGEAAAAERLWALAAAQRLQLDRRPASHLPSTFSSFSFFVTSALMFFLFFISLVCYFFYLLSFHPRCFLATVEPA
ncbi:rsmF [Symbiodinium natans]|uniref:RsmF protein n=1 Tax=Symbiodinium natans TaxID=878477 RepID=A0A812UI30_9DINO|nr:rsmF [Symbiodinium natans]